MRSRKTRAALLNLAVVAVAASAGVLLSTPALAATRHRPPVCVAFACKVIAADVQVRVFQATNKHPNQELLHKETFAQWLPTGRLRSLGDNFEFEGPVLASLAVSGRFVAYALSLSAERYPGEGSHWTVGRLNVQTGRNERVSTDGEQPSAFGPKSPGVTDVAATPAGSIAWIDDGAFQSPLGPPLPGNGSVLPIGSKAVFDLPTGSKVPAVLAVSPTIDPKSLAAIPGRLYWTEGNAPRSASIR